MINSPFLDRDTSFQLAAYLRRIGFAGSPEPTVQCLHELVKCHTQSIPFENLDPFLHKPVSLETSALQEKLVNSPRGGYCYEQNLLFAHALSAIGFQVIGLSARVRWNKSEEDRTARTHMLLKVHVGESVMICDVGFGGMSLTAPLEFIIGREQQTPHETYRLQTIEGGYQLESRAGAEWKPMYAFGTEIHYQTDFEVPNFFVSTHPQSHFRKTLMAAIAREDGRYSLSNARFTIRRLDGNVETRELTTPEDIIETLESRFHISVPDGEALGRALFREGILPVILPGVAGA